MQAESEKSETDQCFSVLSGIYKIKTETLKITSESGYGTVPRQSLDAIQTLIHP